MPERRKSSFAARASQHASQHASLLNHTHPPSKRGRMDGCRAWFAAPGHALKTSAQIIAEARLEMTTRAVETKRPFTPRVKDRRLFGHQAGHGLSRPPSAFSLRQVEFQEDSVRLPPISSPPSQLRPSWALRATSLTNLAVAEDAEDEGSAEAARPGARQTHSSPQERTARQLKPLPRVQYPGGRPFGHQVGHVKGHILPRDGRTRVSSITEEESSPQPDILSLEPSPTAKDKKKDRKDKGHSETKDLRETTKDLRPEEQGEKRRPREVVLTPGDLERSAGGGRTAEATPKERLHRLLSSIEDLHHQDKCEEELIGLLEALYQLIKADETCRKSNKLSCQVIRTLYRFVEAGSDCLLLRVALVILPLRLSGQNLTAINKLIFKISRSDKNDSLFLNSDILELFVEALGWASPLEDAEACIYGYGALKFLTMNQQVVRRVSRLGLVELMTLHIKLVNNARLELVVIPEQTSHALFQLTGAARNMAGDELCTARFLRTGLVVQLCSALELFSLDLDLVTNIARTMSILSTHEGCCDLIVRQDKSFHSIIKVLSKYPGRQDIIVRLGYALGNIIAKNPHARLKLYKEPGGMTAILNLLSLYLDKDLEMMKSSSSLCSLDSQTSDSSHPGSDGSVEDVLVKMIRIVANMSLDKEVGVSMTCLSLDEETYFPVDQSNSRDGGRFLDMLLMVLRRKSMLESEELVMSALTTLNNMSFYAEPGVAMDGPFASRQMDIAQVLSTLLLTNNEDCMVEVTRVLGNLTRSKDVRDYILEIGGISQLVRCLDYANIELLYTTAGVLVNLMADWDKRLAFKENNGIQRLMSVLAREAEKDWRLGTLVCQALWNFCIDSTHLYAALGVQSTNHLLALLADLIDEERLWGVAEGSSLPDHLVESEEYRSWEVFATVATNLLEKIEEYLESMQALAHAQL